MRFLAAVIALACLVLSTVSLVAIAAHTDLGAKALAVMAMNGGTPRPRPSAGIVPVQHIGVIDGGDMEVPRFEGSKLDLGGGSELRTITDRETRCVSNVVLQDGKAVSNALWCFPEPTECEDESLEDSGIRTVRVQ